MICKTIIVILNYISNYTCRGCPAFGLIMQALIFLGVLDVSSELDHCDIIVSGLVRHVCDPVRQLVVDVLFVFVQCVHGFSPFKLVMKF